MPRQYTRVPLADRFWAKVDKNGPLPEECPELGPCWLWTGFIDKHGYGRIRVGGKADPVGYAHHVSLDLAGIPVPPGLDRDHLCRRRHCCRPSHLEPVTGHENFLRGVHRSAVAVRNGTCSRGHEFSDENTEVKANGSRRCRVCRRKPAATA